jgi:hypothetical protein
MPSELRIVDEKVDYHSGTEDTEEKKKLKKQEFVDLLWINSALQNLSRF